MLTTQNNNAYIWLRIAIYCGLERLPLSILRPSIDEVPVVNGLGPLSLLDPKAKMLALDEAIGCPNGDACGCPNIPAESVLVAAGPPNGDAAVPKGDTTDCAPNGDGCEPNAGAGDCMAAEAGWTPKIDELLD